MAKSRMAGDKLKDSTPNEHEVSGMKNYNNENYATDNQYGQDLSGIKYKEGISEHFGGDGSIGENDIKRMMEAGYSADDVYNFSKKKGLNYNQHGQKYMKGQGDYQIGKGSDQWGDVFGSSGGDKEPENSIQPVETIPERDNTPAPQGDVDQSIMPGNPGGIGGGYGPNVNVNQNNDINSTVTGDNNNVTNTQDNSIKTMGGSSREFNGTRGSKFKDAWMQNFFN